MVPSSLINVLSHQMPIIVLPLIFSSAVTGLYFLAIKVIMVPTYFLGTAILEVFKNKAQDELRRIGSCRAIFIKTGLVLFSIGVVPALLLFFLDQRFSLLYLAQNGAKLVNMLKF